MKDEEYHDTVGKAASAIVRVRHRNAHKERDLDEENNAAIAVIEDAGFAGFTDILGLAHDIADELEQVDSPWCGDISHLSLFDS